MKRFLALLICAFLLFAVGCNSNVDLESSGSNDDGSDTKDASNEVATNNKDSASDTQSDSNSESESESESNSDSESDSDVQEESDFGEDEETPTGSKEGLYRVVYPTACSVELQKLAKKITNSINKTHKVLFKNGNDRAGLEAASEYEILVGDTNRPESALGYEQTGGGGWWVSVEDKKIVINGGTVQEIEEAVEYFLENYKYVNEKVVLDDSKEKFVEGENPLNRKNITLRVASYNVKKGIQGKEADDDFSSENIDANIAAIAEDIKSLNLDIVGLQEIDVGTNRTGKRDIVKLIAEAAGYEYYQFTKAIDYDGGAYGSGIISKHEIVEYKTVILPRDPNVDSEERAVGIATVNYNGNKINFLNTHLTVSEDAAGLEAKRAQMRKIAELVDGKVGIILTGDFNTSDTSIRGLIPGTKLVNNGIFKSFANSRAIDDIVIDEGWRVMASGMNDAVTNRHSDHNLIWAEIKYTGGK